ncbi:MAG: glutathione S-transferase family protein [Parvularculales bacterium]
MTDLRIFTYLPNPRLYKATIAARFSGATIDIVGDAPPELANWLWDYDARKLTDEEKDELEPYARKARVGFDGVLYKSDAFLVANPFGTVPAGFGNNGQTGLFESNAIMKAAARSGPNAGTLLGGDAMGQSRVDSFLDRTLVFARDMQRYLLADEQRIEALHAESSNSLITYATGLNQALKGSSYIAGNELTLADIAVACELCQMTNERRIIDQFKHLAPEPLMPLLSEFEELGIHVRKLSKNPKFSEDLSRYFKRLLSVWD